jgi:uncharacterized alkaline shock family protein YloU
MGPTGTVEIAQGALATIVREAASECYGVVGLAPKNWVERALVRLGRPLPSQGVLVRREGDIVVIEVHVVIEYGTRLVTVAQNMVNAIRFRFQRQLGLQQLRVNVFIEDVHVTQRMPKR